MKYCSLESNNEDGFKDLALTVTKFKKKPFGDFYIEGHAEYSGKNVGIGLYVRHDMRGMINNDISTLKCYNDGVRFVSLGACSDEFLKAVNEIYGFERREIKFKSSFSAVCAALGGNPRNIKKEYVQFKCFFNTEDNDNNYAEVYVNIDIPNLKVMIDEKDEDYRENIIRSLSV